jgi:hypothetical protein
LNILSFVFPPSITRYDSKNIQWKNMFGEESSNMSGGGARIHYDYNTFSPEKSTYRPPSSMVILLFPSGKQGL